MIVSLLTCVVIFFTLSQTVWWMMELPSTYEHAYDEYTRAYNLDAEVCRNASKREDYGLSDKCDSIAHLLSNKWPISMGIEDMVFDAFGPLAKHILGKLLVYTIISSFVLSWAMTCVCCCWACNSVFSTKPEPILGLRKKTV